MNMTRLHRLLLVGAAATALLMLGGCSWFSSSNEAQPARLVSFDEHVDLDRQWFRHIGDQGEPVMYVRLLPGIDGDFIYAANVDGKVMAFNRFDGDKIWSTHIDTGADLASAVGAGVGLVFVGSLDGLLVALHQADGAEAWRTQLSGEILSAAQAEGNVVVAQTVDGKVVGLDLKTGVKRWIYESTVPPLTLRGSGTPALLNGVAYVAFATGRVAALNADNGLLLWEQQITLPEGRNELERIIDSNGQPVVSGDDIYVATYQGQAALLEKGKGTIQWKTKISTPGQIVIGHGNLYITTANDTVVALKMATGRLLWENKQMENRGLTSPAVIGNYVAVADYDGYIHLLNQDDGQFAGRYHLWWSDGVRNALQSDGDVLYVLTNGGRLSAFRLE